MNKFKLRASCIAALLAVMCLFLVKTSVPASAVIADVSTDNYEIQDGVYWYTGDNKYTMTTVTIPEGVTKIEDYCFSSCDKLTTVKLPKSLTSIGGLAFQNCSSLKSISIPANVSVIDESAFEGCSGLTSITIPSKVRSIEYGTFVGCTRLRTINFPSALTSIQKHALTECPALVSIVLPKSVTFVDQMGLGEYEKAMTITMSNQYLTDDTKEIVDLELYENAKYIYYETPITSISVSPASKSLYKRQSFSITSIKVAPATAYSKNVTFATTNKKVVIVNSAGKVTAVGKGTAYIRVKSKTSSVYRNIRITVKNNIRGVNYKRYNTSLARRRRMVLTAIVVPYNKSVAYSKTVRWKSMNTRLATVTSRGVVTARATRGTVKIMAYSADDTSKRRYFTIRIR